MMHVAAGRPTLADERAEGERLGGAPVDALARLDHRAPRVVHALHAAVQVKVLRDLSDRVAYLCATGVDKGPC